MAGDIDDQWDHLPTEGTPMVENSPRVDGPPQRIGLDDRFWVGYWIGGSMVWVWLWLIVTMADLPIWYVFLLWLVLTPAGIFYAKH